MNIPVIIEPNFNDSYWCTESFKGIKKQAYRKKHILELIAKEEVENYNFNSKQRVVLIIGSSINWINHIVLYLNSLNIKTLLVASNYSSIKYAHSSCVLMNYKVCVHTLLDHLLSYGNKSIALYGINPNSYTDKEKTEAFQNPKDIYYNYGSLETCSSQFFNHIHSYDSVICANDAVAIHLMNFLQSKGIAIPKDIQLVSFGDFFLSKVIQPSLSCIVLDYYLLGKQAIDTYIFLVKNTNPVTISVLLECNLKIRSTTEKRNGLKAHHVKDILNVADIDFYNDRSVSPIMATEKLLINSDAIDIKILCMSIKNVTQEKIAEELNLSLSALRYRLKRLLSFFSDSSYKEMLKTITTYLAYEDLAASLKYKD